MTIHSDIKLGAKIGGQDGDRQTNTVNRILRLLGTEPGVILADEVGMGKTFVALATAITYIYSARRDKRILVLTPSKVLKDKWDKDIDTFRSYCIPPKSPLARYVKDAAFNTVSDMLSDRKTPIITIPMNRIASLPKEQEMLCYVGAYFIRQRLKAPKRKEILQYLKQTLGLQSLGSITTSLVMNPGKWAFNCADDDICWSYHNVRRLDFECFERVLRDRKSYDENREFKKDFKDACRALRYQLIPKFSFCIVDEAHNYKNPWTVGHRLFDHDDDHSELSLTGKFDKMLFLTATPFQLGYHELLSVFRMLSAARSQATDFKSKLSKLEKLLKDYEDAVTAFEKDWQSFSKKMRNSNPDAEINSHLIQSKYYSAAKRAKTELEPVLRQLIVRNVKPKDHRRVISGACCAGSEMGNGIPIPERDKPLFFSILRLEQEIQRKKKTFTGLVDSMVTSSYSTLKASKLLREKAADDSGLVSKYRGLVGRLIPSSEIDHPKVKDVADKVIKLYRAGEKSLVFTFYIKTAEELSQVIQGRIEKERLYKLSKYIGRGNFDVFIENLREKFSDPSDIRYLAFRENLLLTDYRHRFEKSISRRDFTDGDWQEVARLLGERGYRFGAIRKRNYKILLRAFEHYCYKRAVRDTQPHKRDSILERVLSPDYIEKGFAISETEFGFAKVLKPSSDYSPTAEQIKHLKDLKAVRYILDDKDSNIKNIWFHHRGSICRIDNVALRRTAQEYVAREIIKEDFIIERFMRRKYHKASDETWLDVIGTVYSKDRMFGKDETLKDRVERWISRVADRYERIRQSDNCESEIQQYQVTIREMSKIRNKDVCQLHGASQVNRGTYFEAFNSPFRPVVLICTSIGSEGIDLQQECSNIFLYDLGWNPAAIEQKIGRVDRIGSKNRREREDAFSKGKTPPKLEIYRPYITGTRDERMHRVLENREKWFAFLLGTAKRLSDDENGDVADVDQIEGEEKMMPLPNAVVTELTLNLAVDG